MSSNMRALIEMKRIDQAREEERYRASQNRGMSNAENRSEELASIAHIGNVNRARREVYSDSSAIYADGGVVKNIQANGFVPKAYANGGAVVSFGDLAPANFAGRMQVSGPGMKEYNEKYAFGPGTGRTTAPRNFMNERYESPQKKPANARRTLANGGPVQDVQAQGFVPVKVSNGEFEFTPEQVANIGAAMLASKG